MDHLLRVVPALVGNPNPVTIRNGTVTQFSGEVQANNLGALTIKNMTFIGPSPIDSPSGGTGIFLNEVNNSLISDCKIVAATAISDNHSNGGNRYENVICAAIIQLQVTFPSAGTKTIQHCEFAEPID
jgi:hypothetical protein